MRMNTPVPGFRFNYYGTDVWNTKDPAEWSSDEIRKQLTDCPRAKAVAVEQVTRKARSSSPMIVAPPNRVKSKTEDVVFRRKLPGRCGLQRIVPLHPPSGHGEIARQLREAQRQ
jgi:hypothetical protein